MRKILLVAVGIAVLAGAGAAVALERGPHGPERLFGADANNDGTLTRQEFDAGRAAMFARLDANSDGELAGDEHRQRHWGGHRGMRHMGARADANNDGEITRDEFLARPLEMFARLDADHNGTISAAERSAMHQRGAGRHDGERRHVSSAEFAARGASMFERLDGDGDGRVTREEAEAAHRIRHTRE
jgi:Ca2+-binding EF-hand superfamily protein